MSNDIDYFTFIEKNEILHKNHPDASIKNFNEKFNEIYKVPPKYQKKFLKSFTKLIMKNPDWILLMKVSNIAKFMATEKDDEEWLLQANSLLSLSYLKLKMYDKALDILNQEVEFAVNQRQLEKNLQLMINRGLVFQKTAKYQKALKDFSSVLKISESVNNKFFSVQALLHMQETYYNLKEFGEMKRSCLKGINLSKEEFPEYIAVFNYSLGKLYYDKKEYSKAIFYFSESLNSVTDTKYLYMAKSYLGKANMKQAHYEEAEKFYREAKEIADANNFISFSTEAMIDLSQNFFLARNVKKSFEIAEKAITEAKNRKNPELYLDTLKHKYKLLEKIGEFETACKVMDIIFKKRDDACSEYLNDKLSETKSKFELEMEQMKVTLLQNKNNQLKDKNTSLLGAQKKIKAMERHNSIEAMAVTISHEINQPLSVIIGNLDLLMRLKSDEEQMEIYKAIKDATDSISEIIDKFRNYSSFEIKKYNKKVNFFVFDE
ncbi:MAG: hypothetical protein CSB55_09145 [Candidatus Cloacimonadota bacterium]|nr:MAG: hypothetical protein CSB55_09145 [Candidatus Cloacimonadota bacterium]